MTDNSALEALLVRVREANGSAFIEAGFPQSAVASN